MAAESMRNTTRRPMRVLSAIGPGDVVAAYRDWQGSVRTLSETSITFSSQEFEFFKRHGIAFWAISSAPNAALLVDGENRVENRPRVTTQPVSGLAFHAVQLLYALSLWVSALRFRATHAVVDSGTAHWFALVLFKLAGIEVHPNFHNVYWPVGYEPQGAIKRAVLRLDGLAFRHCARRVLGVSPECGRQVNVLSGGVTQFFDYRAQFASSDFAVLPRPVLGTPMRIVFAGRVEENKGVFDILTICERLAARRPGAFVFDICGSGGASAELAAQIASRRLAGSVTLHGKLMRPELLKVYGESHLVIVPTRSTFCEGLPMVCAEAVIAGRPVLTSRLSNALDALRGALVEAREDDPADYADQIEALADDPARYTELVRNTALVSGQFMNSEFGLTTALERCLLGGAPSPTTPFGLSPSKPVLSPVEGPVLSPVEGPVLSPFFEGPAPSFSPWPSKFSSRQALRQAQGERGIELSLFDKTTVREPALRQAQGERGMELSLFDKPTVREPALRQAQGERGMELSLFDKPTVQEPALRQDQGERIKRLAASEDEGVEHVARAQPTRTVAYLINQYPKVSHTFIRREIQALERLGIAVERIALRGWDAEVADEQDRTEKSRTRYVLEHGLLPLMQATVAALLRAPGKFFGALGLALRMSRRSDRSLPYHLISLAEACRMLPWLRDSGATHLHAHFGTNSAEVAMLAHALGGPPFSFTVHGPEEFDRPEFIGLGEKIRRSAFVVAISSFGRSQLYRWVDHTQWPKVQVVHCGLDAAFHDVPPTDPPAVPRLVCVGRLCEQKGQLLLVEAASRVVAKGLPFELVLAGDGDMRAEVEALVAARGLQAHVRITGWIGSEQVRAEILNARALVLPSFAEGLPVVIMEAMVLRRPVISTFVAGIPELVRPGESGWLFPAGDVDALVAAIEACLATPADALARMAGAAQARVLARHSIDTEAAKLAAAFERPQAVGQG